MGILDTFIGNMDEDRTNGLLASAAQMMAASGPSRTPTSFGQVLAGGIGTYQNAMLEAKQRKMQQEQAAMQKTLFDFKVRDAESDYANQESARQRAESLRQFFMKDGRGGGSNPGGMTPASQMDGGEIVRTAEANGMPTGIESLNRTVGMINSGQIPTATSQQSVYQQRLAMAERLRSAGFAPEADAQEAAALKFQPKVKNWEQVEVGGRILFAPFYEDGSNGQPVPLEVARKLESVDSGQSNDMIDPFTGKVKASIGKKQTLESLSSNAVAMRGQNMADARARETIGQGKIPPGYRMLPDGSMQAIPGGPADPRASKEGIQKTQDASDVLSLLNEAEPLLGQSTSSYAGHGYDQAARFFGASTAGGNAAARLKVLQGQLVAKQPKMSGPQSDKDVQLYREMAGQIGDPTLPLDQRMAAADTMRTLNEKYLGLKQGSSRPTKPADKKSGWSITQVP